MAPLVSGGTVLVSLGTSEGGLMSTSHLKKCVQLISKEMHERSQKLYQPDDEPGWLVGSIEGVLELIDQPWEFSGDKDVLTWRDGYETCMQDIVDAIADEWGVSLPEDPLRGQEVMAKWMGATIVENNDEGAGQ